MPEGLVIIGLLLLVILLQVGTFAACRVWYERQNRRLHQVCEHQDKLEPLVQSMAAVLRAAESRRIRSTKERPTLPGTG